MEAPKGATIGIITALADYAVIAPAVAASGRPTLLDAYGAVAAIDRGAIDVLIVGPRHDWWAELADVAEVAEAATRARLPVLALVPHGDPAALALAFDRGAADCAALPVDPAEIGVRVAALMRRKQTADRMRAEAAEVRRLALTDPVTGVWNRHRLDEELAARIIAAHAAATSLSVVMVDIDRFKPINDRHGHVVGDRVLRTVATRLGGAIRASDTLARFGGDELALVMPDTGLAAATAAAERLRLLVADRGVTPARTGSATTLPLAVTISVGVAELVSGEAAAVLLARADRALYAAKQAGRNRVAAAS